MTRPIKRDKPHKPYPTFPLTAHPAGQWAKKIRGKVHYFGPWSDPQAALDLYRSQAADLHAGWQPTIPVAGVTVKDLANSYLGHQHDKLDAGEIGIRHFEDCRRTLSDWAEFFGRERAIADVRVDEFSKYRANLAKRMGPRSLTRHIIIVKGMLKYAADVGLIDQPPKLSRVFAPPPARVVRRTQRQEELANGKRLFRPDEVLSLIDPPLDLASGTPPFMKAVCVLAILEGFPADSDRAG